MKLYIKDGVLSRKKTEGATGILVKPNATTTKVPDNVTVIDGYAYYGCNSLVSISIPDGVKEIGEFAFYGCNSLISISIPDSVTKIGEKAFKATGIHHLYATRWNSEGWKGCGLDKETLVHTEYFEALPAYLRGCAKFAYIMDGKDLTTECGKEATKFARANAGKYIELIMKETKLMQAMLREKLIDAKDIDAFHAVAREKGDTELVARLLDYQTNVLTTAKVVKTRAKKAEKQEREREQVIDRAAVRANKTDLVGLVFVATGTLNTFKTRNELKEYLEKYGAKLASSVTTKTDYLVTNDTSSDSEKNKKAISLGVDVIDEKKLNEILYRRFSDVTEVNIPEWITVIPEKAFMNCKKLRTITLHEGITEVGSNAFASCMGLTSIVLPNGVTDIGTAAFAECRRLTSIIIPNSVEHIGQEAFSGCESLTSITIPDGVTQIEWCTFLACNNLTSITFPASVTSIHGGAFGFSIWNKTSENLTIHAPAGSYAEQYAKENKIPFEPV